MSNRRQRGLTLIEVLVVVAITGLLTIYAAQSLIAGADYERRIREASSRQRSDVELENDLRTFIESAFLSLENTQTTFFVGSEGLLNQDEGGSNAETLTFTRVGARLSSDALDYDDFELANEEIGTVGGTEEVTISLSATGSASGKTGLFIRQQNPADGDPSQGGIERVLNANVTSISYEFWDGAAWQTVWDTRTQGTARLPAAVRITYRLSNSETDRIVTLRLRNSDVTQDNPVEQEQIG
jgi:prepilin-type N-terminal cleavage/methylation domain-containing protein